VTYAQKIGHTIADLSTLVTSLNLLGRHTEAGNVQDAIQNLHMVSTDGTLRTQPWPIDDSNAVEQVLGELAAGNIIEEQS
jgi:hypothetical protein